MTRRIRFALLFSLIGAIVGFFIAAVDNSKIFERDVITKKYCYSNGRDMNHLEDVWLIYRKSYIELTKSHYCQNSLKFVNLESSKKRIIPAGLLVNVLWYSEDSTYARIEIEYEISYTPFIINEKGYVPVCTLHDSLPPLTE
jgi:hypothetical protein